MKLNSALQNEQVERGGVEGEHQFTIKTTAKAFDILSSGLYSDKVLAVVRELSCNAHDAQVESGTNRPFEIHLPNSLEPFFFVRDYGTGLSDEQIRGKLVPVLIEGEDGEPVQAYDESGAPKFKRIGGLYTTYFDSTKTNSNDYIGALGLGSKSPFSYTKSFQVTSRYEGTATTYTVFINETGIPTVAKVIEVPTDEENGLEVRMAVKPQDFHEFVTKTGECLKFFKTRPKILGNANFVWPELSKEILRGSNFVVREQTSWRSRLTIVMGNVPYLLDINQFTREELGSAYALLARGVIELYFELGDVEVSASRETIQYDPITKQNIISATKDMLKEVGVWLVEKLESDDTRWNKTIMLNSVGKNLLGASDATSMSAVLADMGADHPDVEWYCTNANGAELPIKYRNSFKMVTHSPSRRSRSGRTRKSEGTIAVSPNPNTAIVVRDISRTANRRIAYFLATQHFSTVVEIIPMSEDLVFDQVELDAIIDAFGEPEYYLVSDLEDAPRSHRPAASRKVEDGNVRIRRNASTTGWKGKTKWEAGEASLDRSHLYVTFDEYGDIDGVNTTAKNLVDIQYSIIKYAREELGIAIDAGEIVGITKQSINKVKQAGNWYNIKDIVAQGAMQEIRKAYAKKKLEESRNPLVVLARENGTVVRKLNELLPENEYFQKMVQIRKMIGLVEERKESIRMLTLLNAFDSKYINFDPKDDEIEHDDVQQQLAQIVFPVSDQDAVNFKAQYPMLTLIGSLGDNISNLDIVADYIRNIDSAISN